MSQSATEIQDGDNIKQEPKIFFLFLFQCKPKKRRKKRGKITNVCRNFHHHYPIICYLCTSYSIFSSSLFCFISISQRCVGYCMQCIVYNAAKSILYNNLVSDAIDYVRIVLIQKLKRKHYV